MTIFRGALCALAVASLCGSRPALADHVHTLSPEEITRNLAGAVMQAEIGKSKLVSLTMHPDGRLVRQQSGQAVADGRWHVNGASRLCLAWNEGPPRCGPVQIEKTVVIVGGDVKQVWTIVEGRRARKSFSVPVRRISASGVEEAIGTIRFEAAGKGLRVLPDIKGLAPGKHAFHVHEHPDCGSSTTGGVVKAGMAAGGHFGGLGESGHSHMGHTKKTAGDLPELVAGPDGRAVTPVETSALDISDVYGRSVMIHEHGERPSDPDLAKGGGQRIACAVIPR